MSSLRALLVKVRECQECAAHLPLGPRPVLAATEKARILIIGQAPGLKVHECGVPWDDASGERLRAWLGISRGEFYDDSKLALVPMGFCYPGKGATGDLPPRPECARLWHHQILAKLVNVRLTLLVGRYAQAYRLGDKSQSTLTKTVQAWQEMTPDLLPLPHPSPLNNRWLKKNAWFERDVIPYLQKRVKELLTSSESP